ncbi:MAG: site-2 protease family protein [Acidimicrobiales bacterium]
MNDDIRLGRIAGFPLGMNWSVLVVLWLLTWSLAEHVLPDAASGHGSGTYWIAGLAGALLFFGSLLAHELAHAVVARRAGIEVKGLTLWLFGGVASLGSEPNTPRDDLRIAAAGPATSIGLAVGLGLVASFLNGLDATHIVVAVAGWLAGINLMLGVFNLVPGAPLDGGRILRAVLWGRHRDRDRATITAAHAGRVVGLLLIGLGLFQFLINAGLGGLWTVFIGWFILTAARAEETGVETRRTLVDVRVADVMTPHPQVAPGWITVDDFIEHYLLGSRHSAYPVENHDHHTVGLVTLAQLRAIPRHERASTTVADAAMSLDDVPVATPDSPLTALLERLTPETGGRALVFQASQLVGIVTPADVARAIETRTLTDRHRSSATPVA